MGRRVSGIDTGKKERMENEDDEELGTFDLNEILDSDETIVRICNICQSDKPCTCMRDLVMD